MMTANDLFEYLSADFDEIEILLQKHFESRGLPPIEIKLKYQNWEDQDWCRVGPVFLSFLPKDDLIGTDEEEEE